MKTTLTQLLQEALDTRAFHLRAEESGHALASDLEAETLALNALNEHILELIDARIAKILNTQP